jgi:tryptophan halogenase
MEVPDSLTHRMKLFETSGRIFLEGEELFRPVSWLQVMHGQRIQPKSYHPLTDLLTEEEIQKYLDEIAGVIKACVNVMPSHSQFIADHCAAPRM